jgi:hypothetical protein
MNLRNAGAGIAQWYSAGPRAVWSGFESRQGLGIFLFTTAFRLALGPTQPPTQWVPGALSLGVKWPGREAYHAHLHLVPRSRMHGAILPFPQCVFMALRSATNKNHRDKFTFTFTWYFRSLVKVSHYQKKEGLVSLFENHCYSNVKQSCYFMEVTEFWLLWQLGCVWWVSFLIVTW